MTNTLALSPASSRLALVIRLGTSNYGIPLDYVEVVLPALPIEPVPRCPDFLLGVVFVRGQLIPIVGVAERLGIRGHVSPVEPHIVCLRVSKRMIGLQVDEALDIVDLGQTQPLTSEQLQADQGFFSGVMDLSGNTVRLLDPNHLLANEESLALADVNFSGSRG